MKSEQHIGDEERPRLTTAFHIACHLHTLLQHDPEGPTAQERLATPTSACSGTCSLGFMVLTPTACWSPLVKAQSDVHLGWKLSSLIHSFSWGVVACCIRVHGLLKMQNKSDLTALPSGVSQPCCSETLWRVSCLLAPGEESSREKVHIRLPAQEQRKNILREIFWFPFWKLHRGCFCSIFRSFLRGEMTRKLSGSMNCELFSFDGLWVLLKPSLNFNGARSELNWGKGKPVVRPCFWFC